MQRHVHSTCRTSLHGITSIECMSLCLPRPAATIIHAFDAVHTCSALHIYNVSSTQYMQCLQHVPVSSVTAMHAGTRFRILAEHAEQV